SAAHRNHRHQTRAPQHRYDVARRVTSETGRVVTSLSVIYRRHSRKRGLWNLRAQGELSCRRDCPPRSAVHAADWRQSSAIGLEGTTKLEIIRCLERFVARGTFGYLCRAKTPPMAPTTAP